MILQEGTMREWTDWVTTPYIQRFESTFHHGCLGPNQPEGTSVCGRSNYFDKVCHIKIQRMYVYIYIYVFSSYITHIILSFAQNNVNLCCFFQVLAVMIINNILLLVFACSNALFERKENESIQLSLQTLTDTAKRIEFESATFASA